MMSHSGESPDLRRQWLQDLAEKVVCQLTVKKGMELLSSEIRKEVKEIEYIKDGIAAARRQLHEKEDAIRVIQPRVAGCRKKLAPLQQDRQHALDTYNGLKEAKKDMEAKIEQLQELTEEIKRLETDVRKSSSRLASLQSNRDKALDQKKRLEQDFVSLKERLEKIKQEIPVMRDTRGLIRGERPDHFDAAAFKKLTDDVDMTAEEYVREFEGEVKKIENEIPSLSRRLQEKEKEAKTLLSKKEALHGAVKELSNQVGEGEDEETLTAEKDKLENQKKQLMFDVEERRMAIAPVKSALNSESERLDREKEGAGEIRQRHSYLMSRKQEMGKISNTADEIQRLRDETQRLKRDSRVDMALCELIDALNKDAEPVKKRLRSAIEACTGIYDEFERKINALLS